MSVSEKSIYIIEESDSNLTNIKNILSKMQGVSIEGYSHSTESAASFFMSQQPDILLLDMELPLGSSTRFLVQMKSAYPGIKTIVMSDSADNHYRSRCLSHGADYFIDKRDELFMLTDIINGINPFPSLYF